MVFAYECLAALKSGHVGDMVTRALPVDITRVPYVLCLGKDMTAQGGAAANDTRMVRVT